MHPVLIQIGPLVIRWYGVMIAIACLLGIWVALREAERKGIDREKIQDIFLYAIIGAVIGARLYYVAFADWASFLDNPLSVFAVWQGGLAIHGGILGGLLVSLFYTRRKKIVFGNLPIWVHHLSSWGRRLAGSGVFSTEMPMGIPQTCRGDWFTLLKALRGRCFLDNRFTPPNSMRCSSISSFLVSCGKLEKK